MPGRYEGSEVTYNSQLLVYKSDTTAVLCGFVYSFRIRVPAVVNSGVLLRILGGKSFAKTSCGTQLSQLTLQTFFVRSSHKPLSLRT